MWPVATWELTPLAYTPPYLAEKILTTRSAIAGERKQVTVLFADLKDSTAIALYRAMDMTFWLPQAEAALVSVEGR